jgi:hypothetical protein
VDVFSLDCIAPAVKRERKSCGKMINKGGDGFRSTAPEDTWPSTSISTKEFNSRYSSQDYYIIAQLPGFYVQEKVSQPKMIYILFFRSDKETAPRKPQEET